MIYADTIVMASASFSRRTRSVVALVLIVGAGCTSMQAGKRESLAQADASADRSFAETGPPVDRRVVRTGDLVVSVDAPEEASPEVERVVEAAGGFVEHSTATRDESVWLQCRVPAPQLDRVMDAIAALGEEERRSVSEADVTEQYADLETRLRNDRALRDRLQQLLGRARNVEDVLAIERELNRIQSEIETMQGQLDRLKSQIELSALSITLQRRRILGPLGYVGHGVWWALSKLFVIR